MAEKALAAAATTTYLPADRLGLTSEEVAKMLGIGKTQVYYMVRDGVLVSFKVGRKRRITALSVDQYIARQVAEENERRRLCDLCVREAAAGTRAKA